MKYVPVKSWPLAIAMFAVGGAALGFGSPAMQRWSAGQLGRPGWAVFFLVNIAMPSLIVALSALHPRLRVALAGTFVATILFAIGPRGVSGAWTALSDPIAMLRGAHPILVVASVMYHVIAFVSVMGVRHWRRVGEPPDPAACERCGYRLIGLTEARCPECFHPFDPAKISRLFTPTGRPTPPPPP